MRLAALLFISFLSFATHCIAQQSTIDSLRMDLRKQTSDTAKAKTLYFLSYYYQNYKPDSALLLAQQAYYLSEKHQFYKGESYALGYIANSFRILHNYPKAIEFYIKQLKIEEKKNNAENIGFIYLDMSNVYNNGQDEERALYYAFMAMQIAKEEKLSNLDMYVRLSIGELYEKFNHLDSAAIYSQEAYSNSILQKNDLITGTALNNLGNIYIKRKDYKIAYDYYTKSLPFLQKMEDYNTLCECKLGIAKSYMGTKNIDSALSYAKEVYNLAEQNELPTRSLEAATLLASLYKNAGNIDSAYSYIQTRINITDSIDNRDRIRELQSVSFAEEIRQEELTEMRKKEAEERRVRLQLLAIGILIPLFFLFSLFLSKRKVSHKVVEYSGIVSLLLLFEYITLLIHPVVIEKSHHSPLIEIVVLGIIASLITPAHHKIEKWLLAKLGKMHDFHLSKKIEKRDDKII